MVPRLRDSHILAASCLGGAFHATLGPFFGRSLYYSFSDNYSRTTLQGSAKDWSLGCVKRTPSARGVQDAGITQPRDHSLADPCNRPLRLFRVQHARPRRAVPLTTLMSRSHTSWTKEPCGVRVGVFTLHEHSWTIGSSRLVGK